MNAGSDSFYIANASVLDAKGEPFSASLSLSQGRIHFSHTSKGGKEQEIDAKSGLLLPALNDHHLHLYAAAASLASWSCGPLDCADAQAFTEQLCQQSPDSEGWIRGIGYHPSVAGELTAADIDAIRSDVPVRIQHRGGRMWVCNQAAIERIGRDAPWQFINGQNSGQLLEADDFLRQRLASQRPDLTALSTQLASWGICGVTDTSPRNTLENYCAFERAQKRGELRQRLCMMGDSSLDESYQALAYQAGLNLGLGARKFHLLESQLPDFDDCVSKIKRSHHHQRPVAFHCVTRTELVFALAAISEAGHMPGDRIEHASVVPPDLIPELKQLGVWVVTQPALIAERGDQYLQDVETQEIANLYRLHSLQAHGIVLAGSSDAPYTRGNPWQAIHSAMQRRSQQGQVMGESEGLDAFAALQLFSGDLASPGNPQTLQDGGIADLCLLKQNWAEFTAAPEQAEVLLCFKAGKLIWKKPGF